MGASRKLHRAAIPAVGLWVAAVTIGALVGIWMALGGGSPSFDVLVAAGAKVDQAVADGAWWRLVTAGALHASPLHLALNAVMLGFGIVAWSRLGQARDDRPAGRALAGVAIVVLTSIGGFLASFIVRAGPSVGASAAAHGMLAALVVGVWLARRTLPPALQLIGPVALSATFVIVIVVSSLGQGVDHAAHVGGALVGALLAPLADRSGTARVTLIATAGLVVIVAVAAAIISLSGAPRPGT